VAPTNAIRRHIVSLVLFGIAFGYLEAAVVVYLRSLSEPIRAAAGLPTGDLFPLTKFSQLGAYQRIAKIELAREASTLIMLAAVALAVARRFHIWLAAFALAFGVWDLTFYASLNLLSGWPQSLFTWDLLFLLPVPWIGPILAPVIVAASLAIGGILGLIRAPARVGWIPWMLLMLGGGIILVSFTWDWRNIVDGGVPMGFPWAIFATGELIGVVGFACAFG
jgi:hypothetical protein